MLILKYLLDLIQNLNYFIENNQLKKLIDKSVFLNYLLKT